MKIKVLLLSFLLAFLSAKAFSQPASGALAKSDSLFAKGVELYNARKYGEAIPLFSESDKIDKIALDSLSNRRNYSAQWLASCYYKIGDTIKAEETYRDYYSVAPIDRRLTMEYDSLCDAAVKYGNAGEYENALIAATKAYEILEPITGRNYPEYAFLLNKLAEFHYYLGNYDEAIKLDKDALQIIAGMSRFNKDYITLLNNLIFFYTQTKNYAEAIKLTAETLKVQEKLIGKKHPEYVNQLATLANYYATVGNYEEAINAGNQLLDIIKEIAGNEDPRYAFALNNLANYKANLGKHDEAIKILYQVLEIEEKTIGKEHPQYAIALMHISQYLAITGNYTKSIDLATQATEILERSLGNEHPYYANALINQSNATANLGNFTEAIALAKRALQIQENLIGKENPDYASSLSYLSLYNSDLGNYAEAVRILSQALDIYSKVFGNEHPDYAGALSKLSYYYSRLGNFTEAIKLETEALEIQEKLYGKNTQLYAFRLDGLSVYNAHLGNYDEAIKLAAEALEIQESLLGKTHPDYAKSLHNLASYNFLLGNYAEAIKYETESMEIQKSLGGENNPLYALSLIVLARINSSIGNNSEAIRLATQAAEIEKRLAGKKNPDYIRCLTRICDFKVADNTTDITGLEKLITEINELKTDYIRNQFAGLSSFERNRLWNEQDNKTWYEQDVNRYAYRYPTGRITGEAYDGALLSKGILLQSDIELSRLLLESGDEEVMNAFKELKNTRLMLERLYEKPIAERVMSTDSLERVATDLERDLVMRSKAFGDYTRNMAITWRDVQKKLKKRDIAVEFASFSAGNDSIMYVAYVLTPKMKSPRMIPLFESKELEEIDSADYYDNGELSSLVWGKLADCLKGVENIYFSPSGELYKIGIESLPAYDGQGMMNDRFNIYRLSSTRELAKIKDTNALNEAVLYGGLQYNSDVDVLEEDAKKYPEATQRDFAMINVADSLNIRAGAAYLPATKIEVENIGKSLRATLITPELYMDLDGTEGSFKNLSGKKKSIIHIASHGFYWSESRAQRAKNVSFLLSLNENTPRYVEDKAMTRSGLLFTGANNALRGRQIPETVNDGILTAKEIAALDLRGLDLIVLSACQTALGDISGEGVFGLQRGFKKAGANSLMMSLWKVDDRATQLLMNRFYEEFLSGKSKHEALKLAQIYVREYEDESTKEKPYSNPKYWAAFILLDAID